MNEESSFPHWLATNFANRLIFLGALCGITLTIGVTLTFLGYCTSLQRSGAILVCLAIYGVYINHQIAVQLLSYRSDFQRGNFLKEQGSIHDVVSWQYNPRIPREESDRKADEIIAAHKNAEQSIPKYQNTRDNMIILECTAGIVGTLVWAFGDLLCASCS